MNDGGTESKEGGGGGGWTPLPRVIGNKESYTAVIELMP